MACDDDNEPKEQEAEDDDVELTGLVESVDRSLMRPPHVMTLRAIKNMSKIVRSKTNLIMHCLN